MLVRLRQLHRAADVTLADSTRTEDESSGGTAAASDGGDSGAGCGPGTYGFDATVSFDAEAAEPDAAPSGTPARLGGGA